MSLYELYKLFYVHNFTVLVQSQSFHWFSFQLFSVTKLQTVPVQQQRTDRKSWQLAGEHSEAFSNERYFPQELVEAKTEQRAE